MPIHATPAQMVASKDAADARAPKPPEGRQRVVIENVGPEVDAGRFPARRTLGDEVAVSAAIFADGHDLPAARVLYRPTNESEWRSAPMRPLGNDLWAGSFPVDQIGSWSFTVEAWIDHFESWASDFRKRLAAQTAPQTADAKAPAGPNSQAGLNAGSNPATPEIPLALRTGAILLRGGASRAKGADARRLLEKAEEFESMAKQNALLSEYPISDEIHQLMAAYPDLKYATRFASELPLWVDRERARFSSWYELFPRSASPIPGQHGTFADVERQLPEIAAMGFDILYLPPIHPIGRAFRKGPNNSTTALPGAPGSPWAIGDSASPDRRPDGTACKHDCGGHKSIHPELGTFADFDRLVSAAARHGMEIALDIAFQCSPDHPWVKEHPEWFVSRPDGSIQYAENPPKKYQDIYPLNFESTDWRGLWDELYSVFEFWIERGVLVFRVDNPHTKALTFWEWCTHALREKYPEVIFLAEAFTRPHVMYGLAKRGFTQSYTYFTWRNTKAELQEYLDEITRPPVSDFFHPNFWPNTPDILHKSLQDGGRTAFMQRLILAATLTSNFGIYGPAYELMESAPAKPAPGKSESEEYLDSEKYEIRQRDRNQPGSLVPLITSLNRIRHTNAALQSNNFLRFHRVDNPNLICYSKSTADFANTILIAVNLDTVYEQSGWTDLDLRLLGLDEGESFQIEDLLSGAQYTWTGRRNFIALRPHLQPAHIFRLMRRA